MTKSRRFILIMISLSFLVSFCAIPGIVQRAWAIEKITILYDDDRAAETIDAWKLESDSEALYIRANDVARIFRATQFWNPSARKVILGLEHTRFILSVDTRVVVVDGEPLMLTNPIRYEAGYVMIPLEFVHDIASHYTPLTYAWDHASRTLRVEGVGFNIERLSFTTTANRSTAVVHLKDPLPYYMDANTPGLVRLKVYGGRVDTRNFNVTESHGLFSSARAEQTERDAYLYFDIKKSTTRIRVEKEDDPPRLLLVLEKGELPDIPDPDFADKKTVDIQDASLFERKEIKVEKIVLDPGHGGKDHGKIGSNGTSEKDVNLAIAKITREMLEQELNVEVLLTREDDRLLSLTRRTEIANESGADLFISIHCNSWFSGEIGGFEAYFLSPARTEWDKAVAQAENAADAFTENGSDSDIDFILWDMVQNEFVSESSTLAEFIQKEMSEQLEITNRGVKQANFTVLQGARMPAVLIETAFLSNPREEELLGNPSFHLKVAEGITAAVRKFRGRYQFSLDQ